MPPRPHGSRRCRMRPRLLRQRETGWSFVPRRAHVLEPDLDAQLGFGQPFVDDLEHQPGAAATQIDLLADTWQRRVRWEKLRRTAAPGQMALLIVGYTQVHTNRDGGRERSGWNVSVRHASIVGSCNRQSMAAIGRSC